MTRHRFSRAVFGLTLSVAVLALSFGLGVGAASALPVAFYTVPNGPPGPYFYMLGTQTVQLWVDPSLEPTGITYGIGDIKILDQGALTMNAFTAVFPGTVFSLTAQTAAGDPSGNSHTVLNIAGTGDAINGNSAAFEIGTLTFTDAGGFGAITLFSGDYLDGNFNAQYVPTPQTLVGPAPEPGTVTLLAMGLVAMAGVRRRRV